MRVIGMLAAGLALAVSGNALAAGEPSKKSRVETGDPNRVICRAEDSTGSRLNKTKRCMTAAQWADLKRVDRLDVEKVQSNRWKSE